MEGLPLSCDWLALSLRLLSPVGAAPEGHKWAFYSPTATWMSRWCLYNDYGEKVLTLLFQPRSGSVIKADRALLEIANEWLYHGLGISGVLALLSQSVEFGIMGISRLDLACDFEPSMEQHDTIIDLYQGRCRVAGKLNGNGWWSTINNKKLSPMWQSWCPHDMNWGHKTSDVKWKLYYKTKELRDEAGGQGYSKPYIVDRWREFGLDETNVWRLEVSIKNCNNFDYKGDKLTFDRFMHDTVDIYKALYNSRFKVQRNEGHKDKSNDTVVEFLPIGRCRDAFKVHREDHKVTHNSCLTLLRHLINDVQTEQCMMHEVVREEVLAMIERLLEVNYLHSYFHTIVGESFESWREFVRVKAYYFGREFVPSNEDTGDKMEMAMINAGMVEIHEEPKQLPLGAQSSCLPQRSATLFDDLDDGPDYRKVLR